MYDKNSNELYLVVKCLSSYEVCYFCFKGIKHLSRSLAKSACHYAIKCLPVSTWDVIPSIRVFGLAQGQGHGQSKCW